jgi:hypothetical protein
MNGKPADVCIVEIEVAERGAIGEGSQLSRRPPIGADNGRRAGDRKRDFAADADWPLVPWPAPQPMVSIKCVFTRSIVASSRSS